MRTAFVTGASGFIGHHVVARLQQAGWRVATAGRGPSLDGGVNLGPSPWTSHRLAAAFEESEPDVVFHMAGLTRASSAGALYSANAVLAAEVLDAAARQKRMPRIILAGSAAEYGPVPPDAVPVVETQPCRPLTDYAISKHAQTLMGLARAEAGQPVLIARIWNPVGAGMPKHLALANFASQISALPPEGGMLQVGNLDVARDFIDVQETARLLVALADPLDAIGTVVNVCSGRAYVLRGLVEEMIRLSGRRVKLVADPARMRPGETPVLYGATGRLAALKLQPAAPDFGAILPTLLAASAGAA